MVDVDMVVGAPMAATLGFAYGMGPCLISCAPFLGPVFLASDGGVKKSWQLLLPLSLGRLTAYAAFGWVVGAAGHYVKGAITADSVRLVVGCAVLMMGLALLLRKTEKSCSSLASKNSSPNSEYPASPPPCRGRAREGVEALVLHRVNPHPNLPPARGAPPDARPSVGLGAAPARGKGLISGMKSFLAMRTGTSNGTRTLLPGGLFLMGIGMALSPCAPLSLVLFSAGMSGSAFDGMWLGLSFGLGAILVPSIVYGVGMAYLGARLREQLQEWRPGIERFSALLLVAVGISNLLRG